MRIEYTAKQAEAIKRVRKYEDYYEILDVRQNASVSDIKKAYKKLALLLHPDKNKHSDANEAFRILGEAYDVLSDVQKRAEFDKRRPKKQRASKRKSTSFKCDPNDGHSSSNVHGHGRKCRRASDFHQNHSPRKQEQSGHEASSLYQRLLWTVFLASGFLILFTGTGNANVLLTLLNIRKSVGILVRLKMLLKSVECHQNTGF